MIDPHTRLLRAINLPSPSLTARILRSHPSTLYIPVHEHPSNTALHIAAALGDAPTVEVLLAVTPPPSLPPLNALHQTPLHLACGAGHSNLITLFLSHHPTSLTAKDSEGRPPLLACIISGHGELVVPLLEAGAEPDEADDEGSTALHHAAAYGDLKAIRTLIQAGADPARRNDRNRLPITWSKTKNVEILFQRLVIEIKGANSEAAQQMQGFGGAMRSVVEEEPVPLTPTAEVKKPWLEGRPASPGERPGTPGEGRKIWGIPRPGTPRGRAGSGE
ncbi:MAG: hypothetical protein M1814_001283 [Vezdaea aestivalis]|nr:MAG: hypothetical protein M1814_001283 [Vezdaea aestivalis]